MESLLCLATQAKHYAISIGNNETDKLIFQSTCSNQEQISHCLRGDVRTKNGKGMLHFEQKETKISAGQLSQIQKLKKKEKNQKKEQIMISCWKNSFNEHMYHHIKHPICLISREYESQTTKECKMLQCNKNCTRRGQSALILRRILYGNIQQLLRKSILNIVFSDSTAPCFRFPK